MIRTHKIDLCEKLILHCSARLEKLSRKLPFLARAICRIVAFLSHKNIWVGWNMSPPVVKTVEDLIFWRYAKAIDGSLSYAFYLPSEITLDEFCWFCGGLFLVLNYWLM